MADNCGECMLIPRKWKLRYPFHYTIVFCARGTFRSFPAEPSDVLVAGFTVFAEYLITLSIFYILIVGVILTRSVYGLMLQKALSECIALILLMSCYLIYNDDVISNCMTHQVFHGTLSNISSAAHLKFVVCFFSAIFILLISHSLKEQKLTSFEYLLIILFAILGLMLMCSCNDFLTAYLAIELSSLALYTLSAYKKAMIYSVDSGVKYFVIGALSSSFFLLGVSFIYACTGTTRFTTIPVLFGSSKKNIPINTDLPLDIPIIMFKHYALLMMTHVPAIQQPVVGRIPTKYDHSVVGLGTTFILFSLFIKLAAAPFHLWSLDVYEGSPTSSSFFFAAISKISVFILLLHLAYIPGRENLIGWKFYNMLVGVISIFVGSLGGLRQRKLKTLLAYSSITNVGYVLLSLGSYTQFSLHAICFHIVIYTISVLCLWSGFLFLRLKKKKPSDKYSKELGHLSLIRKSNPALAFGLSLTLFSLSGVPPTVGFLSKVSVFLGVMGLELARVRYSYPTNYYLYYAILSIIFSVVATFYYIRVVKVIYFEDVLVGYLYYPMHDSNTIAFSFLISLLLLLFLDPSCLIIWCYYIVELVPEEFRTFSLYSRLKPYP